MSIETLKCVGKKDGATIEKAIKDLQKGDTLKLEGKIADIEDTIVIRNEKVTIDGSGITLNYSGSHSNKKPVIQVDGGADGVTLKNMTVDADFGTGRGIRVDGKDATLQNLDVLNASAKGGDMNGTAGIYVWRTGTDVTIEDVKIENVFSLHSTNGRVPARGIQIEKAKGAQLKDVDIYNVQAPTDADAVRVVMADVKSGFKDSADSGRDAFWKGGTVVNASTRMVKIEASDFDIIGVTYRDTNVSGKFNGYNIKTYGPLVLYREADGGEIKNVTLHAAGNRVGFQVEREVKDLDFVNNKVIGIQGVGTSKTNLKGFNTSTNVDARDVSVTSLDIDNAGGAEVLSNKWAFRLMHGKGDGWRIKDIDAPSVTIDISNHNVDDLGRLAKDNDFGDIWLI